VQLYKPGRSDGLDLACQVGHRLSTLTTVRIPEGVTMANVRGRLLKEYSLEIGGGLGPLKGKIWRIGLMGFGPNRRMFYWLFQLWKRAWLLKVINFRRGQASKPPTMS